MSDKIRSEFKGKSVQRYRKTKTKTKTKQQKKHKQVPVYIKKIVFAHEFHELKLFGGQRNIERNYYLSPAWLIIESCTGSSVPLWKHCH